jgi:hypothetical protein
MLEECEERQLEDDSWKFKLRLVGPGCSGDKTSDALPCGWRLTTDLLGNYFSHTHFSVIPARF